MRPGRPRRRDDDGAIAVVLVIGFASWVYLNWPESVLTVVLVAVMVVLLGLAVQYLGGVSS